MSPQTPTCQEVCLLSLYLAPKSVATVLPNESSLCVEPLPLCLITQPQSSSRAGIRMEGPGYVTTNFHMSGGGVLVISIPCFQESPHSPP